MNATTTNLVPVNQHFKGVFNTNSHRLINLLNPTEESINIDDIAHALSHICRFGGHCNLFYSVAQHSILVAHLVPEEYRLAALLHDAQEAYLGDVIAPLKHLLNGTYQTLEHNFETIIQKKFGLENTEFSKKIIKQADVQALELEHEALIKNEPGKLIEIMEEMKIIVNNKFVYDANMAKKLFKICFNDFSNQ